MMISDIKHVELKDTVECMLSDNYKDRLMAEFQQLLIRMRNLNSVLDNCDELATTSVRCPRKLLEEQLDAMGAYADVLIKRVVVELLDMELELDE